MKVFCIDWYVNDWVGGTMLMNRAHKGAYMDLLMAQVNNGHMSLLQIKNLLGKEDENLWDEILKDKFVKDPEGKYYNKKIEDQINKKMAFKNSRLKNLSSHKGVHMDPHVEEEEEDMNIIKREELLRRRELKFKETLNEFSKIYPEDMLRKFSDYWTEPNKSRSKMRFEMEKTWDLSRRLAYWANNDSAFNKTKKESGPKTYEEMVKMCETDPDVFKKYRSVKKEGERKAVFYPIDK
jgi:hypothetical protein